MAPVQPQTCPMLSRIGQQPPPLCYAYLRGSLPGCTHCYFNHLLTRGSMVARARLQCLYSLLEAIQDLLSHSSGQGAPRTVCKKMSNL